MPWTEVDLFAEEMKKVLEKNKDKGKTWKNENTRYMENKLIEEVVEYFKTDERNNLGDFICRVIHEWQQADRKGKPKEELVDIANVTMMLWDNER